MMTTLPATPGLAVRCSVDGMLQEILHDDVGMAVRRVPGAPFTLLLDRGSLHKSADFLQAIRQHGIAIGWELNRAHPDGPLPMVFTGGRTGDDLLIVGARTQTALLHLYAELLRRTDAQGSLMQSSLQAHYAAMRQTTPQDAGLYNEISQLNNHLIAAQRALTKANAELERLHAVKNQFLGMAAHDLRSPLGAIMSYSEFLIDEASPVLTVEQRDFLQIIHRSSDYMLTLVNDLLDVAVIESGQLRLELAPTDLAEVAARVVALHRVPAVKKAMTITVDSAPTPRLLLDAAKIEEVLHNLLGNAIKYAPRETTITLTIRAQADTLTIAVQDEGPGIPPDACATLFQPFSRTSVRTAEGDNSTGLGLAIAHRIVQEHGGRLWVDSAPGAGSRFSFSLPLPDHERGLRDDAVTPRH